MKNALIISMMIFSTPAQNPAPHESRPVILAFGDSLTAGYGVQPAAAYPARLQSKLDTLGSKYRVAADAHVDDTTAGGRARMKAALQQKPSIVILELGANDGLRGLPIPQMQMNLDQMIQDF